MIEFHARFKRKRGTQPDCTHLGVCISTTANINLLYSSVYPAAASVRKEKENNGMESIWYP